MAAINRRTAVEENVSESNNGNLQVFTVEPQLVRNSSTSITPPPAEVPTTVERRRFILHMVAFAALSIFLVVLVNPLWLFTARLDLIAEYYDKSLFAAQMLTVAYFITGTMFPFLGLLVFRKAGSRGFVVLVCYVTCLGFWVRCEGTGEAGDGQRYVVALIGQLIMGMAHACYCIIPHHVTLVWFSDHQYTALMVYNFVYKLGLFVSFSTPIFSLANVENDRKKTTRMLYLDFLVTSGIATVFIMILFFGMRDAEGEGDNKVGIRARICSNVKDAPTLLLILSFGLHKGNYLSFISMLGFFTSAKDNGDHLFRWYGGMLSLSMYMIGGLSIVFILRCTDRTRSFLIVLPAGCLLLMISFTVLLHIWEQITLIAICGILGCLYGVLSEIECQKVLSYPLEDRIVLDMMIFSFSQGCATLLTTTGGKMFDHYEVFAPSALLSIFIFTSLITTVIWQMAYHNRVRQVPVLLPPQVHTSESVPKSSVSADSWM